MTKNVLSLFAGIGLMLAVGSQVWACAVPVFRYALERWPADPYAVTILYRGEEAPKVDALYEKFHGVPMYVDVVDATNAKLLAEYGEDIEELAKTIKEGEPRMALSTPMSMGTPRSFGQLLSTSNRSRRLAIHRCATRQPRGLLVAMLSCGC